jgi:hypothetical protein
MLKLTKYVFGLSGATLLLIGMDLMSERWSILDRIVLGVTFGSAIVLLALTEKSWTR